MQLTRRPWWVALPVLALAACVPAPPEPTPAPPPPQPAPAPTPSPTPTPAPYAGHWMDAPLTPGDWRYAAGLASFGEAGLAPRLTMRCESGHVAIAYYGPAAAPASMTIRAEMMERAVSDVAVRQDPAGAAPVVARIPARDPLLDAMAFSKGRFAVEVRGGPTLYVPAYPEVTRAIEDCR